jgi:hypothetical protein
MMASLSGQEFKIALIFALILQLGRSPLMIQPGMIWTQLDSIYITNLHNQYLPATTCIC